MAWNDTARMPLSIHEASSGGGRDPAAVAAEFEGEQVSYAELNRQANQIARRLRARAWAGDAGRVCQQTGLRRLAGLLGIWKASGGYVPLDPELPADRLSFMIADTGMPRCWPMTPARAGADCDCDGGLAGAKSGPRPGQRDGLPGR